MSLRVSADLALPSDAVTQTFAILAKRGVGKTYPALVEGKTEVRAAAELFA